MSESQQSEAITLYADYVCPFCFLGRQSLDRYRETRDVPLAVDWRPFDLRAQKRRADGSIDHSVDDGKDESYYEQAKQNVRRLADEYDVEMELDLSRDVDSLNAQAASLYVREDHPDDWPAFDEAVYDALWREGRDVGDPDVLADLADDAGLDPDEVRGAVDDEAVRERLREAFEAAHEVGVTGVPTFVYGDNGARGAVPPEQLRRLVEGTE